MKKVAGYIRVSTIEQIDEEVIIVYEKDGPFPKEIISKIIEI